ncbi:MAG: hypothetical protein FRX49_08746 [Trebouxia sp. A1-2]|nr:MAG: hypothetical protein FRX49_08746 [Trebouxia sp. A1-2]
MRFHDRADFSADKPTCSMLLAVWGVTPEEATVLANLPQTVLVHASDEQRDHDTSSYSSVSAVFRQHFKNNETLAYLLDNSMKSKQRVHWIPAGYGNFKVMPAFQQSFSSRGLLWSWMGSVVDKPERYQMVELMRSADAEIMDKGLLLVFDVMGGQGSKSPTDYSPILYDTKFVPLPAGTSPEHFRVWETLEAGCIPIVLKQHTEPDAVLWPLAALNFKYITLEEWSKLPQLLATLQQSGQSRFDDWQAHNNRKWAAVKEIISDTVAEQVCKAASKAGLVESKVLGTARLRNHGDH